MHEMSHVDRGGAKQPTLEGGCHNLFRKSGVSRTERKKNFLNSEKKQNFP